MVSSKRKICHNDCTTDLETSSNLDDMCYGLSIGYAPIMKGLHFGISCI